MAEIDRREKQRADKARDEIESKRWRTDLKYERWIVALIILEIIVAIYFAWWTDKRQTESVAKELAAFQQMEGDLTELQSSSKSTADTLASLKGTTETMNGAIQKQVELFYDVELTIAYNPEKQIVIQNQGRTSVKYWGMHFGVGGRAEFFKEGQILTPAGGMYQFDCKEFYDHTMRTTAKGTNVLIPFFVFVKNEKQQRFTIRGNMVTRWDGDALNFGVQTTQITPGWEMK